MNSLFFGCLRALRACVRGLLLLMLLLGGLGLVALAIFAGLVIWLVRRLRGQNPSWKGVQENTRQRFFDKFQKPKKPQQSRSAQDVVDVDAVVRRD